MQNARPLVLASSSIYRKRALELLGLPFTVSSPAIDETPTSSEDAAQLSVRLGVAKAQAVLQRRPDAIVIGSDQVGICAGRILGKPQSHERALEQLMHESGRDATFHTSLVVLSADTPAWISCTTTLLKFRALTKDMASKYLALDQPFECAGSFKAEGLGISLFESISSDDPTALVGLPLIALVTALEVCGVSPIAPPR